MMGRGLLIPLLSGRKNFKDRPVGLVIVDSLDKIDADRAVVIGRAGMNVPKGWELVIVSAVKGYYGPRELNRLLEGIVESLKNDSDRAIVIACPEYLSLHNGFRTFLKFLHAVRDYALLHGSRVYIVTTPESWTPREYSLLRTLEV